MNYSPIIYGPAFIRDVQDVDLIASDAEPLDVTVSVGGSSWHIPASPVLTGGRYVVPLRMREILASVVPMPGLAEAGERDVPIVTMVAGDASMSFRAVYGAAAGNTPTKMAGHWLSWREQVSDTQPWGREMLTFLAGLDLLGWRSGSYAVSVKIYLDGASPVTKTLASGTLPAGCRYVTVDASYAKIKSLVSGAVIAYDVVYSFSGTNSSGASASVAGYPLRLVVARQDVRVKEFVFCNSFGVEDRVYASGRANPKMEGGSVSFIGSREERELRNDAEEQKEVFSGYVSSARGSALWLDFLKAHDRHILLSGGLERIVVDSQESDLQDNAVGSVKFTYHLARLDAGRFYSDAEGLGEYDPTQRYGALYIGDDPAGEELPTEDLFFLKNRLDEFPAADLTEELLFLVQNPLTGAWGCAPLSGIKDWLRKTIQIDQVWVWDGPWDDYVAGVGDAALSARLGKDLDDRIRAIEDRAADGSLSQGFIGTTRVQTKSEPQALTGITDITMSDVLSIGGGRIWWDSEKKAFRTDCAIITAGDQIVIDGEPGEGGGSGGALYLHELLDVNDRLSPSNGDLLAFNATTGAWTSIPQDSVRPDLSDYYTSKQTDSAIQQAISSEFGLYFKEGKLLPYYLPDLFIGTTKVRLTSAAQALTGITDLTMSGRLKIGDAELVWVPASGSTPGYLKLNSAWVTAGDQVLIDGTPGSGSSGSASYLSELLDVSLGTPRDGQALVYDAATDKWVNRTIEAGGSGSVNAVFVGSTKYSPDAAGDVRLPGFIVSSALNGLTAVSELVVCSDYPASQKADALYLKMGAGAVSDFSGLVTSIKVGDKTYKPDLGVVDLGNIGGDFVKKSGDTMSGALFINGQAGGSFNENIRLYPSPGADGERWSSVTFCGDENTATSGTSANTWVVCTNQGNLYIAKNGSNGADICLENLNNIWGFRGNLNVSVTNGPAFSCIGPAGGWTYMRLYYPYDSHQFWDIAVADTTTGIINVGKNLEFRKDGLSNAGVAFRYDGGGGGKIVITSEDNESSIAYNTNSSIQIKWVAGVGTGGSGDAFSWWYNPLNRNVAYLTNTGAMYAASHPTTSDARLKKIERNIDISVEDIANAPYVVYTLKETGLRGAGSLAQYWQPRAPELVTEGIGKTLSMEYGPLALIAAGSIAKKVLDHDSRLTRIERSLGINIDEQ